MSSPLDPTATTAEARREQRIRKLESRIAALEKDRIPQIPGAPTAAAQDGTLVGDSTNLRIWLHLNGVWRFVALT